MADEPLQYPRLELGSYVKCSICRRCDKVLVHRVDYGWPDWDHEWTTEHAPAPTRVFRIPIRGFAFMGWSRQWREIEKCLQG